MLAVSWGLVKVSPLSRNNTVGTLDATVFRETSDLISFQVILILFQNIYDNKPVYVSIESFLLIKFVTNLFTDIDLCKHEVI